MWWQYTDLEESSEWLVSSLEDRQEVSKPAQGSGPVRKSLDSPSTSVWGTSTGKAPKSGQLIQDMLECIWGFIMSFHDYGLSCVLVNTSAVLRPTGLTEAGTGSTLKSSLCSLSDISDSEDISNKYN